MKLPNFPSFFQEQKTNLYHYTNTLKLFGKINYEGYYLNQRDKEKKSFNLYHYTKTLKLLNSLVKKK